MVASLLICLIDRLDRPVDFSCSGASVLEVARQLSIATDLKIKAGPTVKSETLVAAVHEMPVRVLLDRVAEALQASWKEEAGEIILFRSDRQDRDQAARERQMRLDALKKWQDAPLPSEFTEEKAKSIIQRAENSTKLYPPESGKTGEHQLEMVAIAKESPGYRASIFLRKVLDLNAVAEVRKGRRVVFSSQPNGLQKALKKAEPVIDRFTTEMSLMEPYAEASLSRVPESQTALDPRKWPTMMNGRPDRAIVAAYRLPGVPQIPVRTYFVAKNQIVGWVSDSIDPNPSQPKLLPLAKFSLPKELTDTTQNFGDPEHVGYGRSLIERKVEPAAWVCGPLLEGYAKARKLDLVASLSDSAINWSSYQYMEPGAEMMVLSGIVRRYCVWQEKDGVLVVSPALPAESRSNTFDRDRFWTLSRKFLEAKRPRLELAAEYLADEPVEPVNESILSRMSLWTTGVPWSFGFWGTAPPLRFWGRLPKSAQNGSITVGRLTARARAAIDEWIFGTNLALQALEVDVTVPNSGYDIRRLEPTERFPSGLPSEMSITSKVAEIDTIWRRYDNSVPIPDRLDYAYYLLPELERPELSLALEKQRLLTMYFFDSPEMRVESEEPPSPAGLKWLSPKALPAEALSRLRAAAKKYATDSSTVRGTPPP